MQIGFDAKRVFLNATGLGNYGRTLLGALARRFPDDRYFLFTPRTSGLYHPEASPAIKTIRPVQPFHRTFPSAWRSMFLAGEIHKLKLDIFHGLSSELPFGIHHLDVKTVVTVHDLIFERYPGQYNPLDVWTYRKKTRYACHHADRVIAISEQTKRDLISYYRVPSGKIRVVYQSCDPVFGEQAVPDKMCAIRRLYGLPSDFLLYVGSVIERKNLLAVVQAMKRSSRLPVLAVVGSGRKYKARIKAYLSEAGMADRVLWLNERQPVSQEDLASLYHLSKALVYPSVFEGFGIPIQEALWSGTPVITSGGSCFQETGGDAVLHIDPHDVSALARAMEQVCTDPLLAETLRQKGIAYARKFTPGAAARNMMDVYRELKGELLPGNHEIKKPAFAGLEKDIEKNQWLFS